jgi:hypothetical protein
MTKHRHLRLVRARKRRYALAFLLSASFGLMSESVFAQNDDMCFQQSVNDREACGRAPSGDQGACRARAQSRLSNCLRGDSAEQPPRGPTTTTIPRQGSNSINDTRVLSADAPSAPGPPARSREAATATVSQSSRPSTCSPENEAQHTALVERLRAELRNWLSLEEVKSYIASARAEITITRAQTDRAASFLRVLEWLRLIGYTSLIQGALSASASDFRVLNDAEFAQRRRDFPEISETVHILVDTLNRLPLLKAYWPYAQETIQMVDRLSANNDTLTSLDGNLRQLDQALSRVLASRERLRREITRVNAERERLASLCRPSPNNTPHGAPPPQVPLQRLPQQAPSGSDRRSPALVPPSGAAGDAIEGPCRLLGTC